MRSPRTLLLSLALCVACQKGAPQDQTPPDAPSPEPAAIDCAALPTCPDTPCPEGSDCFSLTACPGAARCVPADEVCSMVCNADQCAIAESFPMQVMCEGAGAGPTPVVPPAQNPCADAQAALDRTVAEISACESDAQCGQVLAGTSCGCTRNKVARKDADLTEFEARSQKLQELGCGGMISTCDCPPADGFVCADGSCTWNYK